MQKCVHYFFFGHGNEDKRSTCIFHNTNENERSSCFHRTKNKNERSNYLCKYYTFLFIIIGSQYYNKLKTRMVRTMNKQQIYAQMLVDARATWLAMTEEQRAKYRLNGTVKFAQQILEPYKNQIQNIENAIELIQDECI